MQVLEDDGRRTLYGHLDPDTLPAVGEVLQVNGDIANIATPTNGHSSGPHVHVQTFDSSGNIDNPGNVSPVQNGVLRTPYQQIDTLHPNGHQGNDYAVPH